MIGATLKDYMHVVCADAKEFMVQYIDRYNKHLCLHVHIS